ncbi:hypothetical protein [Streptomyces mirabilis]|uniref:hypothetical protein n=1 Tax=Streptomyces mirabilis TaxID=68239 RepID=UPI00364D2523
MSADLYVRAFVLLFPVGEFFANGKEWLTDFLDDIPSAAVTIALLEGGPATRIKRGQAMTFGMPAQ